MESQLWALLELAGQQNPIKHKENIKQKKHY